MFSTHMYPRVNVSHSCLLLLYENVCFCLFYCFIFLFGIGNICGELVLSQFTTPLSNLTVSSHSQKNPVALSAFMSGVISRLQSVQDVKNDTVPFQNYAFHLLNSPGTFLYIYSCQNICDTSLLTYLALARGRRYRSSLLQHAAPDIFRHSGVLTLSEDVTLSLFFSFPSVGKRKCSG